MGAELLGYELVDNVAVLRFDDGKANIIGLDSTAAFHSALDRVEKEAPGALLVMGRPGLNRTSSKLTALKQ